MTAYRVDEFDDDLDDDEDIDLESEGREEESLDKILEQKDEPVLVSEVIEPKQADTTRRLEKPLEVNTEKILFKTKCQMMQEEIENGKLLRENRHHIIYGLAR